jgi:hypothetical protein
MQTYLYSFPHIERNYLNRGLLQRTAVVKLKNTMYVQYMFSLSLMVFRIIKQDTTNAVIS